MRTICMLKQKQIMLVFPEVLHHYFVNKIILIILTGWEGFVYLYSKWYASTNILSVYSSLISVYWPCHSDSTEKVGTVLSHLLFTHRLKLVLWPMGSLKLLVWFTELLLLGYCTLEVKKLPAVVAFWPIMQAKYA